MNMSNRRIVNFVVTLKSGGDFAAFDAITLSRQVMEHMRIPHRFICLTDIDFKYSLIDIVKLEKSLPGWWSMVEMFRIKGPVIASGLDLVIVGDISRLAEIALTCSKDVFYMAEPQPKAKARGEKWCSGFQIWNGDYSWLYNTWREIDMHYYKNEQERTYNILENFNIEIRSIQKEFRGYYSYKNDCRRNKKPDDARVILFHGNPRPKNCLSSWVRDIYFNTKEVDHPFQTMMENIHA